MNVTRSRFSSNGVLSRWLEAVEHSDSHLRVVEVVAPFDLDFEEAGRGVGDAVEDAVVPGLQAIRLHQNAKTTERNSQKSLNRLGWAMKLMKSSGSQEYKRVLGRRVGW